MISTLAAQSIINEGMRLGGPENIVKPFPSSYLVNIINDLV